LKISGSASKIKDWIYFVISSCPVMLTGSLILHQGLPVRDPDEQGLQKYLDHVAFCPEK
jgi:hypothetical protein